MQIDGCEHWWFEDRGPQCTLLVFVDDATSRLMHLQFVESESTFAYFHAARAYLEAWGKPVALYSYKHGVAGEHAGRPGILLAAALALEPAGWLPHTPNGAQSAAICGSAG